MRVISIALGLAVAAHALPVSQAASETAVAISGPVLESRDAVAAAPALEKRDIIDDAGVPRSRIDIPLVLENKELTGQSLVSDFLRKNSLSRRSSALGLLDVLGFVPADFFPIMENLNVRINADINHLLKQRGTWYDQTVDDMLSALNIEY